MQVKQGTRGSRASQVRTRRHRRRVLHTGPRNLLPFKGKCSIARFARVVGAFEQRHTDGPLVSGRAPSRIVRPHHKFAGQANRPTGHEAMGDVVATVAEARQIGWHAERLGLDVGVQVILDSREVPQFLPLSPRTLDPGVHGEGPFECLVDTAYEELFAVFGNRSPDGLGPHQYQSPAEPVVGVLSFPRPGKESGSQAGVAIKGVVGHVSHPVAGARA